MKKKKGSGAALKVKVWADLITQSIQFGMYLLDRAIRTHSLRMIQSTPLFSEEETLAERTEMIHDALLE